MVLVSQNQIRNKQKCTLSSEICWLLAPLYLVSQNHSWKTKINSFSLNLLGRFKKNTGYSRHMIHWISLFFFNRAILILFSLLILSCYVFMFAPPRMHSSWLTLFPYCPLGWLNWLEVEGSGMETSMIGQLLVPLSLHQFAGSWSNSINAWFKTDKVNISTDTFSLHSTSTMVQKMWD